MCGVAGLCLFQPDPRLEGLDVLAARMAEAMEHRGPDDQGVWTDPNAPVGLCHRRLSIIDCSPMGHQPMVSANGRFVISYNGEIYNFAEIAKELQAAGHEVYAHSDTAVLLEACAVWGVEETLKRCVGMFAFGLWDRETQSLTLARDRLGIKPLYWAHTQKAFVFSSELKALRAVGLIEEEIDRSALASYMRYAYVPAPYSIFKNVHKLLPGHILRIAKGEPPVTKPYWDVRHVAKSGDVTPFGGSYDEAVEVAEKHIHDAVQKRMVSDVPLGAFLSGGIDSSLVVALMQASSSRPVKSFSIGFEEKGFDESVHAKAVAQHIGTDHTELYVSSRDALDVIPNLGTWYDEPFADSSQVPTYLLSKMTRDYVTVALSGDGGDEVFAGYNRYFWATNIWNVSGRVPRPLRQLMAGLIKALPPQTWSGLANAIPSQRIPPQFGDKLYKVADILGEPSIDAVYRRLVSQWPDPADIVIGDGEHQGVLWDASTHQVRADDMGRMQLLDMMTYLPDDILTKVDRASMAVSLEVRVPLIDHRVLEFAWTLPREYLVRNGQGKSILRSILYKHVPRELIERPKMGFGIPLGTWLREDLRDWAEDLLSPERLRNDGFFDVSAVRSIWQDHVLGTRNYQYALWNVLMFQNWHKAGQ
ncbi:asparagine synthase (glutamine-hydrolyzing) [Magnetovibrio sp. PR-2]|uniref:asparagine synthase (glutamine-hydrolyzing) n=1 Tax=Magnetovibrio sp. PR-2 TaxID=3120356 RepID=UPI002FCE4C6A